MVVDAKYVNVKGHPNGMAFLWGVDYLRHDFPVFVLAQSESYQAWSTYFWYFRIFDHQYRRVVCDECASIRSAVKKNFYNCEVQLCYNHVKEGIRRILKVRSEDTYKGFMREIEDLLKMKRPQEKFNNKLWHLYKFYREDPVLLSILLSLEKKKKYLLSYRGFSHCPITTNLMECFNSHLESRLKSIHGFEDYRHARLWLNGYLLKRRYTKFTSCKDNFRKFNGKRPIDQTKKSDVVIPTLF